MRIRKRAAEVPFAPGQLWSLWSIMHKLRSAAFFKALEQAAVTHQAFMAIGDHAGFLMLPHDHEEKLRQFNDLADECRLLGLSGAAAVVGRAAAIWEAIPLANVNGVEKYQLEPHGVMRLRSLLSQATSRISPMTSTARFCLPSIRAGLTHFYRNSNPWGEDVFKAFGSANEDISEACTCLALDRGTACVMHMMRVLEVGLSVLAAALGVGSQNDWGSYLREAEKELTKRKTSSGSRSPDEQFYAEALSSMDNFGEGWRNPTMHPERTYSVERAEEIMGAVRSFMKLLATKLHE